MWREVSSTSPWPAVWPARLVPAPRLTTGTSKRAAAADRGGDVGGVAREGHEQRRVGVQARVAREQVARVGVRAHLAAQLAPQVGGELRAARLRPAVFAQEDAYSLPCIGDEPSQRTALPADPGARRTSRTASCARSTRPRSTTAGRSSPASASRSSRACAASSRRAARSSSTPPPAPARGRRRSSTRSPPATACSRSRPATSRRCGGRWPSGSGSRCEWVEGDWRHGADPERARGAAGGRPVASPP